VPPASSPLWSDSDVPEKGRFRDHVGRASADFPGLKLNVLGVNIRAKMPNDAGAYSVLASEVGQNHAEAMPDRFCKPPPTSGFGNASPDDLEREILIAEVADRIIGFVDVRICLFRATPKTLERRIGLVTELVVSKPHRHRGAGRNLMNAAAAWVRQRKCHTIELNVFEFNSSALALYEVLGYRTISRRLEIRL